MPFEHGRQRSIQYSPAALSNENTALVTAPAGYVASNVCARVLTAGDGSGTLSFGTTSGGTDLMSTANVGVTATGLKGGGIANKVLYTTAGSIWANYTVGTATIIPVVRLYFTLTPIEGV